MKTFFVSTTIPYVNGDPHIGHALEFVEADVVARFWRQKGQDAFFLTGTDENSLKNVRAAYKAGVSVREFVNEYAGKFLELLTALRISNDDFIRTTEERHVRGAQKLWEACAKRGDIYKKKYRGLYCVGCELFIPEKDLVDGFCPEHETKPEVVEEENYFFRLSKYQRELEHLIISNELKIIPESRRNEMLAFIREGLEDFSISRSQERAQGWGVPVPGDETQIMYVWFDALSNYINAVGYSSDENRFRKWWGKESSVKGFLREVKRTEEELWPFWINPFVRGFGTEQSTIVHILGKGVARFHVLYWPAMLRSAGLRLPNAEFIHGYITVDSKKISKSLGNAVNPSDLIKKYGTDAVRYFLLREIPAYEDGDFSIGKFEERYNADLANGLGNFTARVLALANGHEFSTNDTNIEQEIEGKIKGTRKLVHQKLGEFRFNEALTAIWDLISFGDAYVNEKKPWAPSRTNADDKNRGLTRTNETREQIIYNLLVILDNIAALLKPFLPETAGKITSAITWEGDKLKVKKIAPLFPRLN